MPSVGFRLLSCQGGCTLVLEGDPAARVERVWLISGLGAQGAAPALGDLEVRHHHQRLRSLAPVLSIKAHKKA